MLKQLPKRLRFIYLFIYLFSGCSVLKTGAIYHPDSFAFLDMAINRSPVYSMFLKCLTLIFGDLHEIPILITQYLVMVLAMNFLLKILYYNFKLHFWSVLAFQIVFLMNSIIWYNSISRVLSESIAFPLILVLVAFSLDALKNKSFPSLWKAMITLFFLQFTRGQFVVFTPIVLLIAVYIVYQTKKLKKGIVAIVLVALIPVLISFSERVYNKIVVNQYKNYTMTYVHLITSPFYLSSKEDISVFETKEEKDFFRRTYKLLEERKLLKDNASANKADYFKFYQKNFSKICNATIHEANMDYYKTKGFIDKYEQQFKVDKMTTKMFFPLLKANYKSWARFVYVGFVNGLGGLMSFGFILMLFIYSLILFAKDSRFSFLLICISFKLTNALIIAVIVHSINRYTFYFDWVIFGVFILLMDSFLKKNFVNVS